MSVLVFSGMILMIPGLGFVGKFSCMLLGIFEFLCKCTEKLPGHVWNPGRPGKGWIAVYYAVILVIVIWGRMIRASRKDRIREMLKYMGPRGRKFVRVVDRIVKVSDKGRLRPCFAATMLLCILALIMIRCPLLLRNSCTQLYVGQGNCNVMITDAGEVYIFDAGSSSEKNVCEYIIWPYLKYSGLCNVNAIFLSHSDADHINGALELIENAEAWGVGIDAVYITPQMKDDGSTNTEQLLTSCEAAGVEVHTISAGNEWNSGSTHFTCLHPAPGYIPEDPNSGSMCILAEFGHRASHSAFAGASTGDFTLLIPGDVQGSGETALTDSIAEALGSRRLDVYITAHHGSAGTTTVEFLNASHPRLAINSAGLNNRYGHPDPETLSRFRTSGCAYLTLYETGAVTLDLSGSEIEITQYLDPVTH
jgi:competence protein ComEC